MPLSTTAVLNSDIWNSML